MLNSGVAVKSRPAASWLRLEGGNGRRGIAGSRLQKPCSAPGWYTCVLWVLSRLIRVGTLW